jgi:hypothetical protein
MACEMFDPITIGSGGPVDGKLAVVVILLDTIWIPNCFTLTSLKRAEMSDHSAKLKPVALGSAGIKKFTTPPAEAVIVENPRNMNS